MIDCSIGDHLRTRMVYAQRLAGRLCMNNQGLEPSRVKGESRQQQQADLPHTGFARRL